MSSYSTERRRMSLTITFKLGTDLDKAQVLVQNRVSVAEPRLPAEVRALGVTTRKSSPDLMMVVHMLSPDETLRPALHLELRPHTACATCSLRLDGVGDITIFGERQYSLRVWLDPEQARDLFGMTSGDVVAALQEQNVQVAGGALGAAAGAERQRLPARRHRRKGGFDDPRQFRADHRARPRTGGSSACRTSPASSSARRTTSPTPTSTASPPSRSASSSARAPTRSTPPDADHRDAWTSSRSDFPPGIDYAIVYNPTEFIADIGQRGLQDALRGGRPRRHRRASSSCSPGARRSSRSSRSRSRSSAPSR